MDEDLRFTAELTKINFLLENLYALTLREAGASHADVPALSDEICRQARLPADVYGDGSDKAALQKHTELVEHRIAAFFARVRSRMQSAEE